MPDTADTIAAEATPPGRGGVRIVRLSGPESRAFISEHFRSLSPSTPPASPRTAILGEVLSADGAPIDRCLALFFPSPNSFTGEDVAEFHLHGSTGVVRETINTACGIGGIRHALPGEFSYRAYLNGKLSLLEAEALNALTFCDTGGQLDLLTRGSLEALGGSLREIRDALLDIESALEAAIDFPEDVPHNPPAAGIGEIETVLEKIRGLIGSHARTRCLMEGWSLALVGATNTGKSSLFNALLKKQRSIVSPRPGTTRDVVSERIDLEGLPLLLSDMAGSRDSDDELDLLGIGAARQTAALSDGLIMVFDSSLGWTGEDAAALRGCPNAPLFIVANKIDLPARGGAEHPPVAPLYRVSSLCGQGLEDLLSAISAWMRGSLPKGGSAPFSERQRTALVQSAEAIVRALADLACGFTEEVALRGMKEARGHLEGLLGSDNPEELYDTMFSRFCVGK